MSKESLRSKAEEISKNYIRSMEKLKKIEEWRNEIDTSPLSDNPAFTPTYDTLKEILDSKEKEE
ncbi:MAG: hypothetical protein ACE5GR_01670 [Nitrosopumilus sp.]